MTDLPGKATRIDLFSFKTPQMRAFHMTWLAFFACFFAWFGIAPLMPIVRAELGLTKDQVGNTIIASVAITIIARLFIGWILDRVGPRKTYTWLLLLSSIPVMGIGLAHDYKTFLLFRLAIGAIGASFVVTQYHTSVMFASNCVGTANATVGGWGNLGGGVTQIVMPLVMSLLMACGLSQYWGWRATMAISGLLCAAIGVGYWFLTQDTPQGNIADLRREGKLAEESKSLSSSLGGFLEACSDMRVWTLAAAYGACFGIELLMDNIGALYFTDQFGLGVKTAGLVAGSFGMMNIFARALGGYMGDRAGARFGLNGRARFLVLILLLEGIMLIVFSRMTALTPAIVAMIVFSLFVQMGAGATYAVVPFVNRKRLGSVTGIVGAGGNAGAVLSGFLFKGGMKWPVALLWVGGAVIVIGFLTLMVSFSESEERAAKESAAPALEPSLEGAPA